MGDERWRFERVGLGYRVVAEDLQTEIRVTRLKRSSGELHGEVRVTTNLAGVKTVNGVLHLARFNLSSTTTRERLAKTLEKRTPGFDFDWWDGLEHLCQHTMLSEATGQPYLEVGQNPVVRSATPYLLDPVVPRNVATLMYGPGMSGKSVFALALALSVRTGISYIPGIEVADMGNVLYLDWETDAPVINERARLLANGLGQEPPKIVYRRCIRPLYEEAEEIAMAAAERDVIFMVIDSAGMAMGGAGERGDANENTLRLFDAIRHIGVTTLIIDHVSKQEMRSKGKVRGLLPYGSIYKMNLSRSAWEIRNGTEQDDEHVQVSLLHTKANDSRLHEPIPLEIEWQTGNHIVFHQAESDTITPSADKYDTAGAILHVLNDGLSRTPTDIAKELSELDINKNTVFTTIRRMRERGELIAGQGNTVRLPGSTAVESSRPPSGPEPYWNN